VISALLKREKAILFIDEIHTIIGAGATSAADPWMPPTFSNRLCHRELRCIGSTTYEEFKRFFEKDRAFPDDLRKLKSASRPLRYRKDTQRG
jgi:ATP-dependent Clp protease ATP-binding subunit ClpA